MVQGPREIKMKITLIDPVELDATFRRLREAIGQCLAHARHVDANGREMVVTCDLDAHAEGMHHDPDLGIDWLYEEDEAADAA